MPMEIHSYRVSDAGLVQAVSILQQSSDAQRADLNDDSIHANTPDYLAKRTTLLNVRTFVFA